MNSSKKNKAQPPKKSVAVKPVNTGTPTIARRGTLILTLCACLFIAGFIPLNNPWYKKIMSFCNDMKYERKHMKITTRRENRYGKSYHVAQVIKDYLIKNGDPKNTVILFPTNDYLKAKGIDIQIPEPAIFYYYTGLRTVYYNTKDRASINWVVEVVDQDLIMTPINDGKLRQAYLDSLNPNYSKHGLH